MGSLSTLWRDCNKLVFKMLKNVLSKKVFSRYITFLPHCYQSISWLTRFQWCQGQALSKISKISTVCFKQFGLTENIMQPLNLLSILIIKQALTLREKVTPKIEYFLSSLIKTLQCMHVKSHTKVSAQNSNIFATILSTTQQPGSIFVTSIVQVVLSK